MRVTSLIPKVSSNCCFNFNFSNQQSRATIVKKEVKKRLNYMGVKELHHLPQIQKQEEIFSRSTLQNKGEELRIQLRTQTIKTKRCQIISQSPKPISSEIMTKPNSEPQTQRSHSLSLRKSTHSLNIKRKPVAKPESENVIKYSQYSYSITSTSKQTNPSNLSKKQHSAFPILQNMHSSESAQSIEIIIHESTNQNTPLNLQQLDFKDIKSSYQYETETHEGSPTKEVEPFFLLSMLPSSQLPNEYAISREPSSAELIEQGINSQYQQSSIISEGYQI